MTPTLISVFNHSKRITDTDCVAMVHSVGRQFARDIGPIWGQCPAIEFVPKGKKASKGGVPCTISDTPDTPGAAGYHFEGPDGIPVIKVFTFEGGLALKGGEAVSVTFSHEGAELSGDAPANLWADSPDGSDVALELCDPVEGDTYEIDGVSVSNFVYPAYFDPNAQKGEKFDFMGKLTAPFTMTPGGYMIKRTEPGQATQVFAKQDKEHHCVWAAPRILVVFGSEFPEHKKAEKIAKAARRRAR